MASNSVRNFSRNVSSTGSGFMGTIMSLCPPALLYLTLYVISVIAQVIGGNFGVGMAIAGLVMAIIWTWLLNYLCSKGYQGISWFLVFLPFVIIILILVLAISLFKGMSPEDKKKAIEDAKKE